MAKIAVWGDHHPHLAQADGFLEGAVTDHGNGEGEVELTGGTPLLDIVRRIADEWRRLGELGAPTFRLHVDQGPVFENCTVVERAGSVGIAFTYRARRR